jgi:hypothetical protein
MTARYLLNATRLVFCVYRVICWDQIIAAFEIAFASRALIPNRSIVVVSPINW